METFTKKHYKVIAEIIKSELDHWEGQRPEVKVAIEQITRQLSGYFAADNKRYDPIKFMDACGL